MSTKVEQSRDRRAAAWIAVLLLWCGAGVAEDWPHWRGPARDGTSAESGWDAKALSGEWPIAWRFDVGEGYSSVAVVGTRVYAIGNEKGRDIVRCLDADRGLELWQYAYDCAGRMHGGPRATPSVEGDRVYTVSRDGDVLALDAVSGELIWRRDVLDELDADNLKWGVSGSPLVVGDAVFLNVGRNGTALDRTSGRVLWASGRRPGGYATPVPYRAGDRDMLAVFGQEALYAVDSEGGEVAWSFPWETRYDVNAADPIILGTRVFVSSGYKQGCALLDISGAAPAVVWRNRNMSNHIGTSVVVGDYLYGFDGNTGKGVLRCMEIDTGNIVWSGDTDFGSLIVVDGKLIILTEKGRLIIAPADPDGLSSLAEADILRGERCWTSPAFAHGRAYCRSHEGTLVCVDLRR